MVNSEAQVYRMTPAEAAAQSAAQVGAKPLSDVGDAPGSAEFQERSPHNERSLSRPAPLGHQSMARSRDSQHHTFSPQRNNSSSSSSSHNNNNNNNSHNNNSHSHNHNNVATTPDQKSVSVATHLYVSTYSGVVVLEYELRGMSVMRRVRDSALNATQILKVAGVDKSKRTKILEKELNCEYEKVQGGYGKYQGTWVPFDDGVQLCKQYSVYELLEPLLNYNMSQAHLDHTPTKEQALAAKRKLSHNSRSLGSSAHEAMRSLAESPIKRYRSEPGELNDADLEVRVVAQSPLSPSVCNFEESRDIVMDLFMGSGDSKRMLEYVATSNAKLQVDVLIDDSGHTALHWAAALGRVGLVKDLIDQGADCCRGNYAGETPLIRAVLVTNNSELSSFSELLNLLYPALYIRDNGGRSLLHHIALTAGIRGRSDAARYYLESLLEWIVRRGNNSKSHKFGLENFIPRLVNAKDYNGDTALNIAARVDNRNIARQLIEVGADVNLGNRAGLRPLDFGIVGGQGHPELPGHLNMSPTHSTTPSNSATSLANKDNERVLSCSEKRKELLGLMHHAVDSLARDFESEVASKQQLIDQVHDHLRNASSQLSLYQGQAEQLKELKTRLMQWRQTAHTLERAIQDETAHFNESEAARGHQSPSYDGVYDADEPFRLSEELLNARKLPPVLLEARIAAYKRNEAVLEGFCTHLRSRSTHLEARFRRVVSLCTGVAEDQVDDVLGSLVQAVESEAHG